MTAAELSQVSEPDREEQIEELQALECIYGQDLVLLDGDPIKLEISLSMELGEPREVVACLAAARSSKASQDQPSALHTPGEGSSSEPPNDGLLLPRHEGNPVGSSMQALNVGKEEYVPLAVRHAQSILEERGRWRPNDDMRSAEVHYLPPLRLVVEFGAGYPSQRPPRFSLACSWLSSSQLAGLCAELDRMAEEQFGSPVVFTWAQWLQDSAFSHMGLENTPQIRLVPSQQESDERALSELLDAFEVLHELVQFDRERRWWMWRQSLQLCSICFCEKPGSQFTKIGACEHVFCTECMSEMLAVHIADGTIGSIKCPQPSCCGEFGLEAVKALASEEQFQRWQRLKVQLILKEDPALVFCPRCESMGKETPILPSDSQQHASAGSSITAPTAAEEASPPLAICDRCQYAFCAACREAYHPSSLCGAQMSRLQKLAEQLETAQASQRRKLAEELASLRMILADTKPCPKCRMPIVRSQGCNHMCCSNCQTHFCYRCGVDITSVGYAHFRADKCPTFDREEVQRMQGIAGFGNDAGGDAIEAELEELRQQYPDQMHMIWNFQPPPGAWRRAQRRRQVHDIPCPSCRQWNPRTGTNNHIRCRYCKSNFCYACRKAITGIITEHYRAGSGCQQHSS
mmetsp:Transcript_54426/g.129704  ORF Transcript_54426/g.129704 Transcript_54426/m.129704 type:complete len:632 (-) Transcript_54426:79-1974(-)